MNNADVDAIFYFLFFVFKVIVWAVIAQYYTLGAAEQSDWSICTTWLSRKNDIGRLYWTARFDIDPEAAASSRVVAKSHSPRFQTYTKEQLLPILDDKDSKKNPSKQTSRR